MEKIWPLNSRGPQNYSSNKRVKTLPMYSFHKNTVTFHCCFSTLSPLHPSGGDAAEHISGEGRDRRRGAHGPCRRWAAASLPPTSPLPSHAFLYRGPLRFRLGFAFNEKIVCLGKNDLLGKFTKPAIIMTFCYDSLWTTRNRFRKTPLESKAEFVHFRTSSGLGLGTKAESKLTSDSAAHPSE